MRFASYLMGLLLVLGVVTSCSDDDDPVAPPAPVLTTFVIDFENRPDNGFSPVVTLPDTLAPGVVVPAVLPSGDFLDFSTSDGWGVGGCDATAISGTLMMGAENANPTITIVIEFTPAVSKIAIHAGGNSGQDVTVEAFDMNGVTVGLNTHVAMCPMLSVADSVSFDVGSNDIVKLHITGNVPVIDDLIYSRFQ